MAANPKLTIVVEGIGDVVQKFYADPLEKAKRDRENDLSVTFIDSSRFWKENDELAEKNRAFIKGLQNWADYIDKSTRRGKRKYEKLTSDVVFIATPDSTHVDLAMQWLRTPDRCQQIFIEKPLDISVERARDLLDVIGQNDPRVRALDHYCARALRLLSKREGKHILDDLGGRIKNFTFYFLENGSGGKHIGPIENELREKALQNGLILDMMPHVSSVLSYFAKIEIINVMGARVGRYTFNDADDVRKEAAIKKETFAHICYTLFHHDMSRGPMKGNVYIGKGIRGVRELGMEGSVKLLELEGKNSKKYHIDFGSAAAVHLIRKGRKPEYVVDLPPKPYETIIERIVRLRLDGHKFKHEQPLLLDLPIETAKSVLLHIEDMKNPLRKLTEFPTYHLGKGGDEAPFLEDVLENLDPVLPFR